MSGSIAVFCRLSFENRGQRGNQVYFGQIFRQLFESLSRLVMKDLLSLICSPAMGKNINTRMSRMVGGVA